jgi:hypothetical protein
MHVTLEVIEQFPLTTSQKTHRRLNIAAIVFIGDSPDARRTATADLMKEARPGSVRIYRVFTTSQPKDFLQNLNALLDRPGAGKGPEIAA